MRDDFQRIPIRAAVYCNHCAWQGQKPKDNKCPECQAWGRLYVRDRNLPEEQNDGS